MVLQADRPNALPDDRLRLHIDTFDPVSPELVANLVRAVSLDLREFGFDYIELERAGRGSTQLELIARQTAEIERDTARKNRDTAELQHRTAKLALGTAAAGALVLAATLLSDRIKAGEAESGPAVAAVMVAGRGSQCAILVGTEEIIIKREQIDLDNEKIKSIMFDEKRSILRFSAKPSADLMIDSVQLSGVFSIDVENIGSRKSQYLQGQQLLYPQSAEGKVLQAYESQANDDPEIGPSIDAGFVESDERVSVDSSNLNEMFPDAVLPENEPIKLLLFFTYKDPGLDRFFAEILIYEIPIIPLTHV
tara:strand:+ start:4286 stop:5209 length:924 start_codon:yes stop_codon:yes gene_type:complete